MQYKNFFKNILWSKIFSLTLPSKSFITTIKTAMIMKT